MLAAAWLAKGAACGWGLLRSVSPARPARATVAAAARLAGGARRGDPRAALAASWSECAAAPTPSLCSEQGRRLRLRAHGRERLPGAPTSSWSPSFCCCCCHPRGARQPHRSHSRDDSTPGRSAGSLEQGEGRAKSRGAELYENPWTIPNLLSMARIGLAPVLGYLIVEEDFNIALGVFALAGVTDLLDGFIARNWANQKSVLGSALDPLADKILISVLYISLTCANLIPVPLTSMIILRDIALIAAVFYVRYKTLLPPKTLSRYFNPCYATAQLKPTFISKINTVVQLILVAASLAAPVFNFVDSVYLQTLWCITAFTTTASAYSYYHYGRKTVQVLNNK
ncbi:cardiolipin synthase (CMP-forming) [Tiliqua scincoides]|uniref:cardiolipin synthase (CMP-forming) n=1 Tax=Tiliqua scincoides TaxID=71010 RepID=UPI003463501E